MTTPKDAKDLFAEAQAAFVLVVGALNANDFKHLYEAFINILQPINIPGGEVSLSNILLSDDDHKANHVGRTFDCMETPLKYYDDGISGDATNAVRAKAKRLWTAKIELQWLVKTVKRAGRAFFKAVVKETWILPLKEKTTFYNKSPHRDFFDHLKDSSGSLDATNIVSLLSAMLGWWVNDP